MTLDVLKMIDAAKKEVADKEAAKKLNASDFQNALDVIKKQSDGRFSYNIRQPYADSPETKYFDLSCNDADIDISFGFYKDGTISARPIRSDSREFETVEDALGWIVRKLADSHIFNKPAPGGTQPA